MRPRCWRILESGTNKNAASFWEAAFECFDIWRSDVFGRPGSDLLSQVLRLSTIGATGFNGRVRDGIGFWALCNNHQIGEKRLSEFWFLELYSRFLI